MSNKYVRYVVVYALRRGFSPLSRDNATVGRTIRSIRKRGKSHTRASFRFVLARFGGDPRNGSAVLNEPVNRSQSGGGHVRCVLESAETFTRVSSETSPVEHEIRRDVANHNVCYILQSYVADLKIFFFYKHTY